MVKLESDQPRGPDSSLQLLSSLSWPWPLIEEEGEGRFLRSLICPKRLKIDFWSTMTPFRLEVERGGNRFLLWPNSRFEEGDGPIDIPGRMSLTEFERLLNWLGRWTQQHYSSGRVKELAATILKKPSFSPERSLLTVLVIMGVEKAYYHLGLPRWVRNFLAADSYYDKWRCLQGIGGYALRSLTTVLLPGYSKKPKSFLRLPLSQQRTLIAELPPYLSFLGLEERSFTTFRQLIREQDLLAQRREFDQRLATARTEGARREIAHAYAQFQRETLLKTIAQMRIYPGWLTSSFSRLKESCPQLVVADGRLNCLGRTWLLSSVADRLGVDCYYGSRTAHALILASLADGQFLVLEPSSRPGREALSLSPLSRVRIQEGLAHQGEALAIKVEGSHYSFYPFAPAITGALLGVLLTYVDQGRFVASVVGGVEKWLALRELAVDFLPSPENLLNWLYQAFLFYSNKIETWPPQTRETAIRFGNYLSMVEPELNQILKKLEKEDYYCSSFYRFLEDLCFC